MVSIFSPMFFAALYTILPQTDGFAAASIVGAGVAVWASIFLAFWHMQ